MITFDVNLWNNITSKRFRASWHREALMREAYCFVAMLTTIGSSLPPAMLQEFPPERQFRLVCVVVLHI